MVGQKETCWTERFKFLKAYTGCMHLRIQKHPSVGSQPEENENVKCLCQINFAKLCMKLTYLQESVHFYDCSDNAVVRLV